MKNPIFHDTKASFRVIHGGSWSHDAGKVCVSDRARNFASIRFDIFGFRVFRTKVDS